ncbi:hypothetical protein MKX01_022027 [Papaver californicum]|nr:hypothetical protein MKX01_022027 [Papaver californicum]
MDLTESLDYSSVVALLGFSLIVAILRTFTVRDEASRVMVAANLIAFVTTHILYISFYKFDYGMPAFRIICSVAAADNPQYQETQIKGIVHSIKKSEVETM